MPEIVLTEEQARVLAEASEHVVVRRPDGAAVGTLNPADAALIAQALQSRARGGPTIPRERVVAHLAALQAEWDRTGGFDEAYMRAFLDKLRAEDARE